MSREREREQITSVRIPESVFEAIKELAKEEERSQNGEIVHVLREYAKSKGKLQDTPAN